MIQVTRIVYRQCRQCRQYQPRWHNGTQVGSTNKQYKQAVAIPKMGNNPKQATAT
ncbi:hypothetical protein [Ostreibacterium oceani]|uniref:hypothetical protein n=1 Tax=Ostreibacterium oceani TaxID=2654998 RepID=UPI001C407164|nr:hypothetical protein [Ostreibacterium oceani]